MSHTQTVWAWHIRRAAPDDSFCSGTYSVLSVCVCVMTLLTWAIWAWHLYRATDYWQHERASCGQPHAQQHDGVPPLPLASRLHPSCAAAAPSCQLRKPLLLPALLMLLKVVWQLMCKYHGSLLKAHTPPHTHRRTHTPSHTHKPADICLNGRAERAKIIYDFIFI